MLVTGTDFIDGRVNYSTCVYVDKERFDMDPHIILRENDVLLDELRAQIEGVMNG